MENHQIREKDKRKMVLIRNFQNPDLRVHLKEYHHLLDTLVYLIGTLTEPQVPVADWKKYAEALLMKFTFHGFAVHRILSGIPLSTTYYTVEIDGKIWLDIASARAVLRSKMETFLMFHHIYVNPDNDSLKELRYNAWIYTALLHRQNFPAKTEFSKKQIIKDQEKIKHLKKEIQQNVAFLKLSERRKKALIEKGSAKLFDHWSTIMEATGFAKNNPFTFLYEMLSIYFHAEGLSIVQLEAGKLDDTFTVTQTRIDLHHSKMMTCMMMLSFCRLYEQVNDRFLTLPQELQWDIEFYTQLAMNPQ